MTIFDIDRVDIDPKYKPAIAAYMRKYATKSYEQELWEHASLLVPLFVFALINLIGTYGVVALDIQKLPRRAMRFLKVSTLILLLVCLVMIVVVHLHHHAKCTEKKCSTQQLGILQWTQSCFSWFSGLNEIMGSIGAVIWVWIFWQQIVPYTAKPFAFVDKIAQGIGILIGVEALARARANGTYNEMANWFWPPIIISGFLCVLTKVPACVCFVKCLFAGTSLVLDLMYTFLIGTCFLGFCRVAIYFLWYIAEFCGVLSEDSWNKGCHKIKMFSKGFRKHGTPTLSASAATAATTREKANSRNLASIPQFGELKPGPIAAKYTSTKHKCKMLQYFEQHCTVDGGKPATEDFIKARLVDNNIHDDHEGVRLCVMQEIIRVGLWGK